MADVLTPFCMSFLSACYSLAVPLKPSNWVQTHWSGERAILTLVYLNKEDEGMYTLRVNTKSGFDTYSAYVFVRGNHPETLTIFSGNNLMNLPHIRDL